MNSLQLNPETGMVFDPQSGVRFKVNAAGALLVRGWQTGRIPAELLQELCKVCDLSTMQAERAYLAFTRQCRAAGLCPPALPTRGTPSGIRSDPRNSSAA